MIEHRVVQHAQHHCNHNDERQERHVLPAEESSGSLPNGVAYAAHQIIAGIGTEHPRRCESGKNQGKRTCGKGYN